MLGHGGLGLPNLGSLADSGGEVGFPEEEPDHMKDIRSAIVALLIADPVVSSMVGGERIRPIKLPQGDRGPSIVYHRITGIVDYHLLDDSGLIQSLFQFDSVATSANAATQLANAVFDVLSGYRGVVQFGSSSPQDSIAVHAIFQTNERDLYDSATELMTVQRDFAIWYWAT